MNRPLRIGIDGTLFREQPRGHSLYAMQLFHELPSFLPDAEFFLYTPSPIELTKFPGKLTQRVDSSWFAKSPVVWQKLAEGKLCRADALDVFWSPYVFLPKLPRDLPAAVTLYDFVHEVTPDSFHWLHALAFRLFFKPDLKRAQSIITISRGTQQRIRQRFDRESIVVLPGLNARFQKPTDAQRAHVLQEYGLDRPYLLNVATWDPRKNVATLIKAFLAMKEANELPDYQLVLVGRKESRFAEIEQLLQRDGGQHLRHLGYISDDHLPALYGGAKLFVFPSLYEGYGMPAMESRACGTRVVTSDLPEIREAGGDDSIYIEPTAAGIRAGILEGMARNSQGPLPLPVAPSWHQSARILAAELQRLADRI